MVRRGVPTKNLTPGDIERAANDTVRRVVTLQQGMPDRSGQGHRQVPQGPQVEEGPGVDSGRPGARLLAVEGRAAGGDAPAARARFRRRAAVRQLPGLSEGYRMMIRRVGLAALSVAAGLTLGCGRGSAPPAEQPAPDARAAAPANASPAGESGRRSDVPVLVDFDARVKEYVALHRKLEDTLPPPLEGVDAPADRQPPARAGAAGPAGPCRRQTRRHLHARTSRRVVQRLMARVFGGPTVPRLKASIMDENPGPPEAHRQRALPGHRSALDRAAAGARRRCRSCRRSSSTGSSAGISSSWTSTPTSSSI